MKIVVAPNALKGSLSARQAALAIATGIRRSIPDAEVIQIPVADGGDGIIDVFHDVFGGEMIRVKVPGPLFDEVEAEYLYLPEKSTAIVEMARASGLSLLREEQRCTGKATTLGTGALCKDALDRGAKTIIVGLGGSATTDGGIGFAAALGARFFDKNNSELLPIGDSLGDIAGIDLSGLTANTGVQWVAVCDVDNPLTGPRGAAAVYGPQKGASQTDVARLDAGLDNLSRCVQKQLGFNHSGRSGVGAAGGLGFGLVSFFGAELQPGVDVVLDAVELNEAIKDADLVITAEGGIDEQTAYGKAPAGVGLRSKQFDVPCVVIAGGINGDISALYDMGITACFSLCPGPVTLDDAMHNATPYLAHCSEQIARLFLDCERNPK